MTPIWFTSDSDFVPPNQSEGDGEFRHSRWSPEAAGGCRDSSTLSSSAAAWRGPAPPFPRHGWDCRWRLIQDRPVLGGNNSSDVRVHLNGGINLPPYPRLGDVVKELDPGNQGNARPAAFYNDDKKLRVVQAEQNIHLFLNTHARRLKRRAIASRP